MADRRRINGPPSGTHPPIYASSLTPSSLPRPQRTRAPTSLRKIYLRTGLTPSASGSSYLELSPSPPAHPNTPGSTLLNTRPSTLKLTATIHGPHPLPRSAPFSPNLLLTCSIKYAPFASRTHRRGFVRDAAERDLGVHLETALRGVVVGERWPKSGVDVVVTVLEGEEDGWWGDRDGRGGDNGGGGGGGYGAMTVLAGAITAASAALVDAGIDCVDLVSGGVAAVVSDTTATASQQENDPQTISAKPGTRIVLDPCPAEHERVVAACVVGYLQARDEITEIWMKGSAGAEATPAADDGLIDRAVEAAVASRTVLAAALKEATEAKLLLAPSTDGIAENGKAPVKAGQDVEMTAA